MYTFDDSFSLSFKDWDKWETRGTIEDIRELEEAERMVMLDEALMSSYYQAKDNRAQRLYLASAMKMKNRVKTMAWQKTADAYKKSCKKKGYDLKQKSQTRKDCRIVPADALGWDKTNMSIMGKKLHGVKVGYIFDVT